MLQSVPKNTILEVLDFLKNRLRSISQEVRKIDNDTLGRHRFGLSFDSKFYVTKRIFSAVERRRGFDLEVMRKSKLNRKYKKKIKNYYT